MSVPSARGPHFSVPSVRRPVDVDTQRPTLPKGETHRQPCAPAGRHDNPCVERRREESRGCRKRANEMTNVPAAHRERRRRVKQNPRRRRIARCQKTTDGKNRLKWIVVRRRPYGLRGNAVDAIVCG